MNPNRIERLRRALPASGVEGFYTEDPVNIFYLTGFHAPESGLVVSAGDAVFVTDFRTLEEARNRLEGLTIVEVPQGAGPAGEAARQADRLGLESLGFESRGLAFATAEALRSARGTGRVEPLPPLVEPLRARKEEAEVLAMERSLDVAQKAFLALREELRPGMTEKEASDRLAFLIRHGGAKKEAFDFCVLAGERAALPHGEPVADRFLKAGESLLIDFGAFLDGYACDLTRMIYFGEPVAKSAEIHGIVREAQRKAIEAVKPGVPAKEIDRIARSHIEAAGYGAAFGHGLGHGVGLEVHESPRISWMSEDVLQPGHVFTVEPGIYLPGDAGVRLEDMVVVTETGARVLSSLPSALEASAL